MRYENSIYQWYFRNIMLTFKKFIATLLETVIFFVYRFTANVP